MENKVKVCGFTSFIKIDKLDEFIEILDSLSEKGLSYHVHNGWIKLKYETEIDYTALKYMPVDLDWIYENNTNIWLLIQPYIPVDRHFIYCQSMITNEDVVSIHILEIHSTKLIYQEEITMKWGDEMYRKISSSYANNVLKLNSY